jgi:hypothetical protein
MVRPCDDGNANRAFINAPRGSVQLLEQSLQNIKRIGDDN